MSLSIIVPTIGRPSLMHALDSISQQLAREDEVLIVADGPRPNIPEIAAFFDVRFRFMESPGPAEDWGATPRNYGIERALNTHLGFMDDDDVYLPDALDAFRTAIRAVPDKPHIFRMQREKDVIWNLPVVRGANVSTQMYLIPNVPGRVGRWSRLYDGDLHFLQETLGTYPEGQDAVVWHEEIVSRVTAYRKGVF